MWPDAHRISVSRPAVHGTQLDHQPHLLNAATETDSRSLFLDRLVAGVMRSVTENHEAVDRLIRKLFTGSRFRELMIESMAEYFTVGELLSLTRFYRGEGVTVAGKLGHYMGIIVPEIILLLQRENLELFRT